MNESGWPEVKEEQVLIHGFVCVLFWAIKLMQKGYTLYQIN